MAITKEYFALGVIISANPNADVSGKELKLHKSSTHLTRALLFHLTCDFIF